MRFWVKERFLVKAAFVRKMGTLDKKVIKKGFLSREVPSKEKFLKKKLAFDFISLFFQKSQSRLQLNRQCQ